MATIVVNSHFSNHREKLPDLANAIQSYLPEDTVLIKPKIDQSHHGGSQDSVSYSIGEIIHVTISVPWDTLGGAAAGVVLEAAREWVMRQIGKLRENERQRVEDHSKHVAKLKT